MKRRNFGMSLIEVMIGLAIAALMFTAVAMAIQAGARSTTANQDFFAATQAGRLGMSYLLRTIRQSDPEPANPNVDEVLSTIQLTCDEGAIAVAFSWDQDTGELTMDRNGKQFVVARHVTAFACRRQSEQTLVFPTPGTDEPPPATWHYANYQVNMTVSIGDQSIRFCESVVPRRALVR